MAATLNSVEQPAFAGGGGQVGGLDVCPKGPMVPDISSRLKGIAERE